jgi:hypothetical protein
LDSRAIWKTQLNSSPSRPVSDVKLPEKSIFIGIKCSHPDFWEIKRDAQSSAWTVNQPDVGRIGKNKEIFMSIMSQERIQRRTAMQNGEKKSIVKTLDK